MERKCESVHSKHLSCRTPTVMAFSSPYVIVVMRVKCRKTVTRGAWKKLGSRTRNAPSALFARLMEETFLLREHRCSSTWTRAPSSRLVALFSSLSFSLVWDSTDIYIYSGSPRSHRNMFSLCSPNKQSVRLPGDFCSSFLFSLSEH